MLMWSNESPTYTHTYTHTLVIWLLPSWPYKTLQIYLHAMHEVGHTLRSCQVADLQRVFADRCSSTAAAMAAPSEVAVPLPSSSKATRLAGVALFRAAAVSASSTKNVDWPDMTSSLAPMRTKMASTGVRVREWAGTQAPTWAIRAARHTCVETEKHWDKQGFCFKAGRRLVANLLLAYCTVM